MHIFKPTLYTYTSHTSTGTGLLQIDLHNTILPASLFSEKKHRRGFLDGLPSPASLPLISTIQLCGRLQPASLMTNKRREKSRDSFDFTFQRSECCVLCFSSDAAAPQLQQTTSYDQEPPAPAAWSYDQIRAGQ